MKYNQKPTNLSSMTNRLNAKGFITWMGLAGKRSKCMFQNFMVLCTTSITMAATKTTADPKRNWRNTIKSLQTFLLWPIDWMQKVASLGWAWWSSDLSSCWIISWFLIPIVSTQWGTLKQGPIPKTTNRTQPKAQSHLCWAQWTR